MDQYEEKALKDIEQYGCHILHVMEEGEYPGFSYSIRSYKASCTGYLKLSVTMEKLIPIQHFGIDIRPRRAITQRP